MPLEATFDTRELGTLEGGVLGPGGSPGTWMPYRWTYLGPSTPWVEGSGGIQIPGCFGCGVGGEHFKPRSLDRGGTQIPGFLGEEWAPRCLSPLAGGWLGGRHSGACVPWVGIPGPHILHPVPQHPYSTRTPGTASRSSSTDQGLHARPSSSSGGTASGPCVSSATWRPMAVAGWCGQGGSRGQWGCQGTFYGDQ